MGKSCTTNDIFREDLYTKVVEQIVQEGQLNWLAHIATHAWNDRIKNNVRD